MQIIMGFGAVWPHTTHQRERERENIKIFRGRCHEEAANEQVRVVPLFFSISLTSFNLSLSHSHSPFPSL